MSSGFSGGFPEFYSGRSIAGNAQIPYRPQQQHQQIPPGIILDPAAQILQRRADLIRKRPLPPEFQTHNHLFQQHHQFLQQQAAALGVGGGGGGLFRSVKPRTYHQTSPISTLSPVDFAAAAGLSPEFSSLPAGRFGLPILRPQAPTAGMGPGPAPDPDPEKKMMNRLQELEKQLLDDENEDDQTDAVSVVTNSEWSETIQSLMTTTPPPQQQLANQSSVVSPSPTSSTSSSSSSSCSVASPPQTCVKQTLVDAAAAIAEANAEKALEILTRLSQVSDPKGRPEQRVAGHLAAALRRRVSGSDGGASEELTDFAAVERAMQALYEASPCFKLSLWTANQAILDATSDLPEKIHVVYFDGGARGPAAVQYLSLVHALAARQGGKPVTLRITTVGEPGTGRSDFGDDRLRKLGERGGVSVEFDSVSQAISDLTRDSLGCGGAEEALVVNLAFKLFKMPDESVRTDNPRDELLRRVKGLQPRVVTVVEQEMNGNTAPFMARVGEVCVYYTALFDSLDSASREGADRARIEDGLARKMANTVACEGPERVERCEVFGKWRARLRMAGLEPRPLSQNVADSVQARVNSGTRGGAGFFAREETGGICFGWMGRTLTVTSAWR